MNPDNIPEEWSSDRILDTMSDSREAMHKLRVALNTKRVQT